MKSGTVFMSLVVFVASMAGSVRSWASSEPPGSSRVQGGAGRTHAQRLSPQETTPHSGSRTASYGQREAAAQDLKNFVGGQEIVLFTPYDYHIMGVLLLVTAIVLVVILI
jgi:hypothetical protein